MPRRVRGAATAPPASAEVTPKASRIASTVAAVEVSSRLSETRSSSTRRRFIPRSAKVGRDLGRRGRAGARSGCRRSRGLDVETARDEGVAKVGGEAAHAARDAGEARGAVPHGIHARHDGEEHLGGADVGRRLLAADVLLARLQGEAVGLVTLGVDARRRRGGRAAGARGRGGRPCSRRAVRRSPSARRSAGRCRPRCRRPTLRARSTSVSASRSAQAVTSAPAAWAAAVSGAQSTISPVASGYCTITPTTGLPSAAAASDASSVTSRRSATTSGRPIASARVRITAIVCGKSRSSRSTTASAGALLTRRMSDIASAAAVASSSSDEPATSRPVRSVTTVWKLSSASSRPCEISGW